MRQTGRNRLGSHIALAILRLCSIYCTISSEHDGMMKIVGLRGRGEGRSLYENALGSSVRTTSCAKTDGALGTTRVGMVKRSKGSTESCTSRFAKNNRINGKVMFGLNK